MDVKYPKLLLLDSLLQERSQDASGQGFAPPTPPRGEEKAQVEEACPASQLLLHGRQVPRLLQDHHCVQPRPDSCGVRRMFQSFASPLEAAQGLLRAAASGGSSTKDATGLDRLLKNHQVSRVLKHF